LHGDLATPRVIAMDFVEGEPLDALTAAPQGWRNAVGTLVERLLFRELFEFRVMQTDPNFANHRYQPKSRRVVLLDYGATRNFAADIVGQYTQVARGLIEGDREAVARAAIRIGCALPDDAPERIASVVDAYFLVCEPFRRAGRYNFAGSDMPARGHDRGLDLAFRKRVLRPSPPETLFPQRELGPQDFVSRADREVEAFIHNAIAAAFPGHAVLGEETAVSFAGPTSHLWIVDPFDGTTNFLRGLAYWTVSIAYVEGGVRTLGAVGDPAQEDFFHARRGAGAWCTDVRGEHRLASAPTLTLRGSVVAIDHHDRHPDPRLVAIRVELMNAGAS
jgi:hypothetical protein